jgi:methyl-accepting chemotaxis protein
MVKRLAPLYTQYSKAGDVVLEYNAKTADERGKSIASMVNAAVPTIITVGAIGLVLGLIIAFLTVRAINKALKELADSLSMGAEQTASASAQVSASSQSLAEGASEQAASLEETSSSIEEMSSMIKRNSENAEKANELAKRTRTAADKGAADMQAMSSAMQAIQTSSSDISKIIKTIDEIAFQTNILALNAAVEAARAGEAGMGFAVVADEVRNLAQRSAQAAKETAAKIEGSISKTDQGVQICATVGKGLEQIVQEIRKVDELVAEVSTASKEQSQGISQVNLAVGQMDKVTQSNAASAEETASASEELNAQAEALKEAVSKLVALVEGSKAGQPSGSKLPLSASHRVEIHHAARQASTHSKSAAHAAAPETAHQPTRGNGATRLNDSGRGTTPVAAAAADKEQAIPLDSFKDF